VSERQLREAIVECARRLNWLVYWTWNSKHSPAGMPDLTMVRDGRLIFAELKVKGRVPTAAQREWLETLGAVPGAVVALWREDDWLSGRVEDALR
jgi:hypothetical protein